MKKVLSITLIIIIILATSFHFFLASSLYTATGFTAKNICSGHFISGFSGELVVNEGLLPVHKTFSYVDFKIDDKQQLVTTSAFGLYSRKAIYTSGIGCTLLAIGEDTLSQSITKLPDLKTADSSPWAFNDTRSESASYNINYNKLNQSVAAAFEEPAGAINRRTKAVVVIHQGQLVAEKYSQGVDINTALLSWSMAKSITNIQVGLLVKDGKLDITKTGLVPQWKGRNDRHAQITLDQLMRMSSGLEFNEFYGMGSDAALMLSVEPSASEFAAAKPVEHEPDTHWAYSSGTSNIISGIVKRAIGGNFQRYYEYTQRRLFRPLGISSAQLEADARGTFIGSSYMYATAREWAKLGQLFLQDGVWNDQRLLPEGWVKYSTTPSKTDTLNHYGAHWWLNNDPQITQDDTPKVNSDKQHKKPTQRKWPSVPQDAYFMSGFQGQFVVVIPSKDLVVVRLGYRTPGTDSGIEALLAGVIEATNLDGTKKDQPNI